MSGKLCMPSSPGYFFLHLPQEALGLLCRRSAENWTPLPGELRNAPSTSFGTCQVGACLPLSLPPGLYHQRKGNHRNPTHTERRWTEKGHTGWSGQSSLSSGCTDRKQAGFSVSFSELNASHSLFVLWESVWSPELKRGSQRQKEMES